MEPESRSGAGQKLESRSTQEYNWNRGYGRHIVISNYKIFYVHAGRVAGATPRRTRLPPHLLNSLASVREIERVAESETEGGTTLFFTAGGRSVRAARSLVTTVRPEDRDRPTVRGYVANDPRASPLIARDVSTAN
ncbi:hypothetical protein EVAR_40218_1 [Eumeta japonica]|uniref:Uncharacterized protein n=1 Tax=Eumeta variegata TaxID=151549 RepID=A0A4C1XBN3_EUMVA|nr:hypothetical protein EVAR_40218_1 [Eumeta japonica]